MSISTIKLLKQTDARIADDLEACVYCKLMGSEFTPCSTCPTAQHVRRYDGIYMLWERRVHSSNWWRK